MAQVWKTCASTEISNFYITQYFKNLSEQITRLALLILRK